jgi:hypothetical protein
MTPQEYYASRLNGTRALILELNRLHDNAVDAMGFRDARVYKPEPERLCMTRYRKHIVWKQNPNKDGFSWYRRYPEGDRRDEAIPEYEVQRWRYA